MRSWSLLALSVVVAVVQATSSRSPTCTGTTTLTKALESSHASRVTKSEALADPTSSFSGVPLGPGGNLPMRSSTVRNSASQPSALDNPDGSVVKFPTRTPPIPPAILLSSTNSASSASPSVDSQLDACWASTPCMDVINDFGISYEAIGGDLEGRINHDPGGLDMASLAYVAYFCKMRDYEKIITNGTVGLATPIEACLQCFKLAGVNTESQYSRVGIFLATIEDFCHVKVPNLYYLFGQLLDFMQALQAPKSFNNTPLPMTAVVASLTAKSTLFSSTNAPIASSMDPPTASDTQPWWQIPLTPGGPIPTEYLSQLPSNWPYTAYNIMHSAGETTAWPFVNPNATTQTVAWLYHSIIWNPRPLHTPKMHKSSFIYNPLLEDWTHSFIYDTAIYTPPPSSTPSKITATSRTSPFSPTITQASVMPMEPDSDAEIRASMRSRSEAEKSQTTEAAVLGSASVPEGTELSELMHVVSSMRSKLDEKMGKVGINGSD